MKKLFVLIFLSPSFSFAASCGQLVINSVTGKLDCIGTSISSSTLPSGSSNYWNIPTTGTFNASHGLSVSTIVVGEKIGIVTDAPINHLDIPVQDTSNSIGRIGNFELSSYSQNNDFFGPNIYYNGLNFVRREAGYGGLLYFQDDEVQIHSVTTDSAGSNVGAFPAQLKIRRTGEFGVGPSIGTATGDFTGSKFYVGINGDARMTSSSGSWATYISSVTAEQFVGQAFIGLNGFFSTFTSSRNIISGLLSMESDLYNPTDIAFESVNNIRFIPGFTGVGPKRFVIAKSNDTQDLWTFDLATEIFTSSTPIKVATTTVITGSSITANSFYGDGSHLTGISGGSQIYPATATPSLPFGVLATTAVIKGVGTSTNKSFIYTNSLGYERASIQDNGQINVSTGATGYLMWTHSTGGGNNGTFSGIHELWPGSAAAGFYLDDLNATLGDFVYSDESSGSPVVKFRVSRSGNVTIGGSLVSQNQQFGLLTSSPMSVILGQRFPAAKADIITWKTFSGTGDDQYRRMTLTSGEAGASPGTADLYLDNCNLVATGAYANGNYGTVWTTSSTVKISSGGSSFGIGARVGGCIWDHYVSSSNNGTTETDLYVDVISSNVLSGNCQKIEAWDAGNFTGSGTATKDMKVYVGTTVVFDSGAVAVTTNGDWRLERKITRANSTQVRCIVAMNTAGASTSVYTQQTDVGGLNFTGSITFKITGTAAGVGAATGDVVSKLGTGYWYPASN